MAVAEKYRVDKPFKWLGQQYERGDAISRSTILSDTRVGEARLGSLQRVGFISLVDRPLSEMNKAELVDYGHEVGAKVSSNMTNAVLIKTIESEL